MRQKCRLIANPSPAPPYRLRVLASASENASNSRPNCSSVMPMPVSVTANVIQSPSPARVASHAQADRPSLAELGSVAHQVEERLANLRLIGMHHSDGVSALNDQGVRVLLDQRLHDRLHVPNQIRDAE